MRKVIQLVKVPSTLSSGGSLYALCDDGSIWYCEITRGGMRESILKWERVPGPPAEDVAEDTEPL